MEKFSRLSEVRLNANQYYSQIRSVFCPYFQEHVFFTSEGFNHIRYRKGNNEREFQAQEIRYRLLDLAVEVIRKSATLQEYESQTIKREVEHHKQKEIAHADVRFFGFIAIINHHKIKIIVRKVGQGQRHFWSIIPNWKTRRAQGGEKIIQVSTGNLDQD